METNQRRVIPGSVDRLAALIGEAPRSPVRPNPHALDPRETDQRSRDLRAYSGDPERSSAPSRREPGEVDRGGAAAGGGRRRDREGSDPGVRGKRRANAKAALRCGWAAEQKTQRGFDEWRLLRNRPANTDRSGPSVDEEVDRHPRVWPRRASTGGRGSAATCGRHGEHQEEAGNSCHRSPSHSPRRSAPMGGRTCG